jgi:hypothetical protein
MYRNLRAALVAIAVIAFALSVASVGLVQGSSGSATLAGSGTSALSARSTGAQSPLGPIPPGACGEGRITLGSAANFEVLAGTTVTNTGATTVHGNLGVSPGSAVTGFPPGKVTGAIDRADTAAANGQTSLVRAYTDGMARSNCPITVAGNIGGKTLSPGLYHSSSSLAISSGTLTLTGSGGSGKVFIFQVTSKLTVTSGRQVVLAGGALASNVFWVVGSSATLGTNSVVYGTILSHKSISIATGAVLHGRALAHIGAVTLAGNTLRSTPFASSVATPNLAVTNSGSGPVAIGTSTIAGMAPVRDLRAGA